MKALNREEDEFAPALTPLIDVVFLLIVFFLVSTTFATPEKGIGVELPTAEEAGLPPERERTVVVTVEKSGLVVMHGRALAGYNELTEALTRAHEANPDVIVVVRGDRRAMHNDIVRVFNAALAVGIEEVSIAVFDTEQPMD